MTKTLGKDYDERLQSKKLRNLVVEECFKILSGKGTKDKRFQQALLLKLAGTVLPRLNEITGQDGESFEVVIRQHEGTKDNKPA